MDKKDWKCSICGESADLFSPTCDKKECIDEWDKIMAPKRERDDFFREAAEARFSEEQIDFLWSHLNTPNE